MGNDESRGRNSNQLQDKEIAVLKANSNLSETQIREYYDEFKLECPSGKMNKSQFRKYFKTFVDGDEKKSALADQLFPIFDKNGDGTVNFSEFVLSCGLGSKNDLNSQLDLAFTLIDTSGDGNITFQEMTTFSDFAKKVSQDKSVANLDPTSIAKMIFDMFNLDKHQKLSKHQFIQGCKANRELQSIFT